MIRLTRRLWEGRRLAAAAATASAEQVGRRRQLLAAVLADVPAPASDSRLEVRAAVAAGDRLRLGLGWEWRQDDIEPGTWAATVAANRPDLVLLELADGVVPGWGDLGGKELNRFTAWCREVAVPLVVWVTSGRPDALVRQLEVAACIFVADATTATSWQESLPGQRVDVLLPAAQPRMHGPARVGRRGRECGAVLVTEARDRTSPPHDLRHVVPAVKPMHTEDVDVWQVGAGGAVLPAALQARLVGVVPYPAITTVPARYRVLLDAGRTGEDAPWAVMEAGMAQTPVVALPAHLRTMPADLATLVVAANDPKALRGEIVARIAQPELRDREGLRLHRAIFDGHTFAHRVDSILAALTIEVPTPRRSISVIVPTNRAHEIDNIFENVGRQSHRDLELVLVLHAVSLDHRELDGRARSLGVERMKIIEADAEQTLGSCLNLALDAADGTFVAKMDDDNYYGRHYLRDLVRTFDYTDAGIVGKWAHYVWLRSSGAVVLRYFASEHAYERRVQGGSMLFHGDLVRSLRFADLPRAVDSDILDRAIADGVRIYSSDRFNFVSIRGTDRHAHTWTATDSSFMTATGRLVFYGDPRPHVEV